ncbi:MAG: M60 family metallopeptidase, partial [Defluviitaleaceae bacterium]|nr:M60 family metallopeptidase [Defluviitaleaceae bacterium]
MNNHDDFKMEQLTPSMLDDFQQDHPVIIDTYEQLGLSASDFPAPIQPFATAIQPINAVALATLSQRSFDIEGKGRTVREWQSLHRKLFPWWPYAATGIFCRANESIQIRVHGDRPIAAFIGTRLRPTWQFTPTRRPLNPGLNTISDPTAGLLYFSTEHTGTISVEIVSGGVASPRFILGKHTLADWQTMFNGMTESGLIELESDRSYVCAGRQNNINNGDPIALLHTIDQSVVLGDEVSGLSPHMPHERDRPDPHQLALIEVTSHQAAGFAHTYATGYTPNTMVSVLHAAAYRDRHSGWTAWHEQGHMRQQPAWIWYRLIEVTVDIYAMYIARAFGNDSRLEARNEYANAQNFRNRERVLFSEAPNDAVRLVMFWQLMLAFGVNFYARLHQLYRMVPANELPGQNSGQVGEQLFIYMASLAANRNLTPFLERWGIFPSVMTASRISHLPPLVNQIWNGRDSAPIVEYIIPNHAPLEAPTPVQLPQLGNLNGHQGTIRTAVGNGPGIDASGDHLVIQAVDGSDNQRFAFIQDTGDIYAIRSIGRQQFLVDSDQYITLTPNQASATRWRLTPTIQPMTGVVSYTIQSMTSQRMIDLAHSSTTNGNRVGTWGAGSGNNQRWIIDVPITLEPEPESEPEPEPTPQPEPTPENNPMFNNRRLHIATVV